MAAKKRTPPKGGSAPGGRPPGTKQGTREAPPKASKPIEAQPSARPNPANLAGPLASVTVYRSVIVPALVPTAPPAASDRVAIENVLRPHLRDVAQLPEALAEIELFLSRLRVLLIGDRELRKVTRRSLDAGLRRVEREAGALAGTLARLDRDVGAGMRLVMARRHVYSDPSFPLRAVAASVAELRDLAKLARERLAEEEWPTKRRRDDLGEQATRDLAAIWERYAEPSTGAVHTVSRDWAGPFPSFARAVIGCAIPTYRGRAAFSKTTPSKRKP